LQRNGDEEMGGEAPMTPQNPLQSLQTMSCDLFGRKVSGLYMLAAAFFLIIFFGFKGIFILMFVMLMSTMYKSFSGGRTPLWLQPNAVSNPNGAANGTANKNKGGTRGGVRTISDLPSTGVPSS
jgi:hypothetical protein